MSYQNNKLEEFNEYIRYRKVAVIGLGVSNLPLLDYLASKKAKVTIFDEREKEKMDTEMLTQINQYQFTSYWGKDCLTKLTGFDVIFRSPSCLPTKSELVKEANRGAMITTEVELLMKMSPCQIIGVTGSDGKTTTTSLIHAILEKAGYHTYLGGNIGTPLFTKLSEMRPEDKLILELSSFQLMGMSVSPDIAVITNITPNHLNIHKDYQEYIQAKKSIFNYQRETGIVVLNADNEITKNCAKEVKGKVIFFSRKTKLENGYWVDEPMIKKCEDGVRMHLLNTNEVLLKGSHNYENIAAALAATENLVDSDIAVEAVREFHSVEHRLELVREIDGVKWINDSVSSSPTRTMAGLNAFQEEIVLIAGGYDKNLDYTPLAKPIVEKVKTLLLLGQTSGKIFDAVKRELENQNRTLDIYVCEDLKQTVQLAKKVAKRGQVVLFSPASASFDLFKNFADRGEKFKAEVNLL
jgi:UDP-N-acetylmuramoylalanine--D-glutamate ligase